MDEIVLTWARDDLKDMLVGINPDHDKITNTTLNVLANNVKIEGFLKRKLVETDDRFVHGVSYSPVVRKTDTGTEVLVYCRDNKLIGESRLSGKLSIGWGGHISMDDYDQDYSFGNTLGNSIIRELAEELNGFRLLMSNTNIQYLFDEDDEVGKYHIGFGITVDGERLKDDIEATDNTGTIVGWYPINEETLNTLANLEPWSKIYLRWLIDNVDKL